MAPPADLLLANARVLTLDPACPRAEAVAVRAGRIVAVGAWAELRALVGPTTTVLDAEGGIAIPAFHDAHLHLLPYARAAAHVDCRPARSLAEIQAALAVRARTLPPGAWVRAGGYDEARLVERRHPDRHDLDAAVPDRPVRLQHRSLHLDVLNTPALRALGLLESAAPGVERDPTTGAPTGRLYHAAALLRARLPRPSEADLAAAVRAATRRLLAWGVTSVQDATHTNGPAQWALFTRLAVCGALGVRVFLLPGAEGWPALAGAAPGLEPTAPVLLGPVKLMLDEATSDPATVRAAVAAARAAGRAVALHAVSEAEVALALDALRAAGPRRPGADAAPDRLEHAAVLPEAWLPDLRALGVAVVGQPALVAERGDVYRAAYPPAFHGWLHRAASLVRAGIRYAIGSDAPVTEPSPGLALRAARDRLAPDGAPLGPAEALRLEEALTALTLGPARAVGAAGWLGQLRPGFVADIAVLDPDALEPDTPEAARRPVRLTLVAGRVAWRR